MQYKYFLVEDEDTICYYSLLYAV